jgi:hypothetical protein
MRYLTPALQPDLLAIGNAVWAKVGGLDADGLLKTARTPLRDLGVPGDAVGRFVRGVVDLAHKQGLTDFSLTPDQLLAQSPIEFATTLGSWSLTFVQDPAYLSGEQGRWSNEGLLRVHLLPLLRSRAKINPSNWDVSAVPASRRDDGTDLPTPIDIERIGVQAWNYLGKLDEDGFKAQKDRRLPDLGISDDLIDSVADGLSEQSDVLMTTPEVLRGLSVEDFVDYLVSWHTGFQFKRGPDQAAETALRWVRAGFKPW